jgi:hypothetical protein
MLFFPCFPFSPNYQQRLSRNQTFVEMIALIHQDSYQVLDHFEFSIEAKKIPSLFKMNAQNLDLSPRALETWGVTECIFE